MTTHKDLGLDTTDDLLVRRSSTHGEFMDNAQTEVALCEVIDRGRQRGTMHPTMVVSLRMLAHKIARAINGDPYNPEHWEDMAGYARLVETRLKDGRVVRPARIDIDAADRRRATEQLDRSTLHVEPGHLPGTPEDGGHHERHVDAEVYKPETPGSRHYDGPDDRRVPRYQPSLVRQPRDATAAEYESVAELQIMAGSQEGSKWCMLYTRGEDGRYKMLPQYTEEYGR
jgi:hypothetical protein